MGGNPVSNVDPNGLQASSHPPALPGVRPLKPISPEEQLYGPLLNSDSKGDSSVVDQTVDEVEKHMSWLANKFKCFVPPKLPGQSLCSYRKNKVDTLKECIERKQAWDDRWKPGEHKTNIEQMKQELLNIDSWLNKFCKDEDCK